MSDVWDFRIRKMELAFQLAKQAAPDTLKFVIASIHQRGASASEAVPEISSILEQAAEAVNRAFPEPEYNPVPRP